MESDREETSSTDPGPSSAACPAAAELVIEEVSSTFEQSSPASQDPGSSFQEDMSTTRQELIAADMDEHVVVSEPFSGPGLISQRVSDTGQHLSQQRITFGSDNSGLQAGTINGPVHATFHYEGRSRSRSRSRSMFASLVEETEPLDATMREVLARRAHIHSGRQPSQHLATICYGPYINVRNRKTKVRLLELAQDFQFLDRGFADFFQWVVPAFGKEYVQELLVIARGTICKIQNKSADSPFIDLGDLGNFCEQSAQAWNRDDQPKPMFVITHRRDDEILHYLQDALEVPYWEFMLDLFMLWRANNKALSGDIVLRVIYSMKLDVNTRLRDILKEIAACSPDDREDLTPIIDGIRVRLKVLDSVWDSVTSSLDHTFDSEDPPAEAAQELPTNDSAEASSPTVHSQPREEMERITLITFVVIFLIAAIIPGYKSLAISMQESQRGSTTDAEYWGLIQNSIMAVLGNIITVIPLMRKSWLLPAYGPVWAFSFLGLVFASVAISVYPFVNPGWSSMIAFFGSVASTASVLVMTQITVKQGKRKAKID